MKKLLLSTSLLALLPFTAQAQTISFTPQGHSTSGQDFTFNDGSNIANYTTESTTAIGASISFSFPLGIGRMGSAGGGGAGGSGNGGGGVVGGPGGGKPGPGAGPALGPGGAGPAPEDDKPGNGARRVGKPDAGRPGGGEDPGNGGAGAGPALGQGGAGGVPGGEGDKAGPNQIAANDGDNAANNNNEVKNSVGGGLPFLGVGTDVGETPQDKSDFHLGASITHIGDNGVDIRNAAGANIGSGKYREKEYTLMLTYDFKEEAVNDLDWTFGDGDGFFYPSVFVLGGIAYRKFEVNFTNGTRDKACDEGYKLGAGVSLGLHIKDSRFEPRALIGVEHIFWNGEDSSRFGLNFKKDNETKPFFGIALLYYL